MWKEKQSNWDFAPFSFLVTFTHSFHKVTCWPASVQQKLLVLFFIHSEVEEWNERTTNKRCPSAHLASLPMTREFHSVSHMRVSTCSEGGEEHVGRAWALWGNCRAPGTGMRVQTETLVLELEGKGMLMVTSICASFGTSRVLPTESSHSVWRKPRMSLFHMMWSW